jgi:hypothetical protein
VIPLVSAWSCLLPQAFLTRILHRGVRASRSRVSVKGVIWVVVFFGLLGAV